jgi:hypothetical protein
MRLALLGLLFSPLAMAWPFGIGEDQPPDFTGFHYQCGVLKAPLIVQSDGGVHFIFPDRDIATEIHATKSDKDMPTGSGGKLIELSAWAASTIIRIPNVAFTGVSSFRLPISNVSFMGYGTHKAVGSCKLMSAQ